MSAIVQRIVTFPAVRTEYLMDSGAWGERKAAHIFPSHAIADEVAKQLREKLQAARRVDGTITAAFVHARCIEASERFQTRKHSPGEAVHLPAHSCDKIWLDPKRMAEVLRDPAESYE